MTDRRMQMPQVHVTRSAAFRVARQQAAARKEMRFIVRDEDGDFAVCDEWDLDTFFQGEAPLACIDESGMLC
jgi:hypothetical protein